jgi:polygalacturonase
MGLGGHNAFLIGKLTIDGGTTGKTLVIDQGVTVYASRNPASYGTACVVTDPQGAPTDTSTFEDIGAPQDTAYDCGALIDVTGANVSLMGAGTLDGQGGEPFVAGTVTPPTVRVDDKNGPAECDSVAVAGKYSWWGVSECLRHDNRTAKDSNNPDGGPGDAPNPSLINVSNASDFVLYKLTLLNSPRYHVQLNSDRFLVWGINIHTPSVGIGTNSVGMTVSNYVARNTDGIDPGAGDGTGANGGGVTQDGYIVYNTISTGDDMSALKGNAEGGANNIVIAHNHFGTGHGMSLGSATMNGITNVHVYDLTVDGDVPVDANTGSSDLNGLRVKSYTGNGGFVNHVLFEDVCTRDEVNPIDVTSNYTANPTVHDGGVPPNFQDITFKNFQQINGTGVQHAHEVDVTLQGNSSHNAIIAMQDVYIQDSTNLTNAKKKAPELVCGSTTASGSGVLVANGTSSPASACTGKDVTLTGSFTTGVNSAATNPCTNAVWWPTPVAH